MAIGAPLLAGAEHVTMARRAPAYRRYIRRSLAGSAIYVVGVAVATAVIPDDAPANAGSVVLAIVAGSGVLVWIWALSRYLVELDDEYLRMLQVRGMLVATAVTLGITSVWGLVELFTTVPRLPVFFVYPLWCLGLLVGALVNRWTVGDAGEACP
ncbi:MAG TPA: hypothetical protein VFS49_11140 [Croceibacterium sp.]|nr:hypothetical protein [Croceibacterium sp.]